MHDPSVSIKDEDKIFKYQISLAENALLGIDEVLQSPAFKDPGVYFVNTIEEKKNDLKAFVMKSNMAIPFGIQVAENALWNLLGGDNFEQHCYDYHVAIKSDTVVARSFGVRSAINGADVDFRVKWLASHIVEFGWSKRDGSN
ncbi:hypothetical protein JM16_006418 [Phytophthora kernoviae]|uniref:Uncharacterized protein n=1 Tax=Phytophthora kernoviae TaxID=325452 RepID=A0A8T0LVR1_9STRA|nr:hypothetical protein JM16_006418 [Phytophthora kernoviae]